MIVGDIDIAIMDVFAPNPPDEMGNRIGHGVDVPRRACHRLGQHVAFDVINPRRQIARFAH